MLVPKVSILERVDCTHGGGFQNGQCVNLYGTCIKLSINGVWSCHKAKGAKNSQDFWMC